MYTERDQGDVDWKEEDKQRIPVKENLECLRYQFILDLYFFKSKKKPWDKSLLMKVQGLQTVLLAREVEEYENLLGSQQWG